MVSFEFFLFLQSYYAHSTGLCAYHVTGKGKGAHKPKAHTAGAYTDFRSMKHAWEYCCSSWTGYWSIAGLPLSSVLPVPIYTPGWRATKWSKVPCLRKQRDVWGLNPGPPNPEFEVLTARSHTPPGYHLKRGLKNPIFYLCYHVKTVIRI